MWTNIYEKNMFLHEVINKMRATLQNNLNTEQALKKLHSIKNNLLHHYTLNSFSFLPYLWDLGMMLRTCS